MFLIKYMTRQLMTTIEELEVEKFLRARYSGELIGDSESMLHKNKDKDIFSCHVTYGKIL